jgi:hypothetical protein
MKDLNWQSIWGRFEVSKTSLRFIGEQLEQPTGPAPAPGVGLLISDSWFSGGTVEATVEFSSDSAEASACELVLYFDPDSKFMVTAGIGGAALFSIRHWGPSGWIVHATSGDRRNLTAGRKYAMRATLRGSSVALSVDGVVTASTTLPFPLPQSQIGVWCSGNHDIVISRYAVNRTLGRAFIVMPFSGAFDDLHKEVIRRVCRTLDLEAFRADEHTGPGLVVADIAQQIREAQVVIADVTDPNCNVYFEVGFAHALSKPTVLLAQEGTNLPFDLAPLRTLFYQNTIGGKSNLETVLREW